MGEVQNKIKGKTAPMYAFYSVLYIASPKMYLITYEPTPYKHLVQKQSVQIAILLCKSPQIVNVSK